MGVRSYNKWCSETVLRKTVYRFKNCTKPTERSKDLCSKLHEVHSRISDQKVEVYALHGERISNSEDVMNLTSE